MLMRRTAAVVLLVLTIALSASAQQSRREVVTGQSYLSTTALKSGAEFKLAIRMSVRKGYHIGAPTAKDAYPSKLSIKAPYGVTFDAPVYPQPSVIDSTLAANGKLPVYNGEFTVFVNGHVSKDAAPGERTITGSFTYQACDATTCSMPAELPISVKTRVVGRGETVSPANADIFGSTAKPQSANRVEDLFARGGFIGFAAIFLMGLLLCFTPCVYPMIPVTIGFFGMQCEKCTGRLVLLASLYVIGIAVTYSVLGMLAARAGRMFGEVLQNPYVPAVIAAVLVALGLSMFGLYEIRPPSWLAAKSQGKSGPVGALLMGLLFGVVAAPCVAPVTVGLLTLVAKVGKPIFGFTTFFTLAIGMGTPLFVLAIFSGAINRLPQAGMWMVTVKKVFGLLLIGAAIYYLTPLIDTRISHVAARQALPLFVMACGLYLGWLEPSLRKLQKLRNIRKLIGLALLVAGLMPLTQPTASITKMTFRPYSEAAVAKAVRDGKPVMIDFTAEWCAACKELEQKTFPASEVRKDGDRFVRLRVDLTDSNSPAALAAKAKYHVLGLPTIVFLDDTGSEVKGARVIGFISPKDMSRVMKSVK